MASLADRCLDLEPGLADGVKPEDVVLAALLHDLGKPKFVQRAGKCEKALNMSRRVVEGCGLLGFTASLRMYLNQLSALRQRGASEDSIRDAFLTFLREAFPRLSSGFEPFLLEAYIPALRLRGGFADILYGDLIFEFKRHLNEASRREGKDELRRYLSNQHHPERFFGVLTDGEALEVYVLRGGDLVKTDHLRLDPEAAEQAKFWLDCYLFHERHLDPVAEDVVRRFGESSPTFWHSIRILEDLWRQVGAGASVQIKFAEWQSLLAIVYGSPVGDAKLFLRHTYLALFARVLAFVALERRAPDDSELSGVISGEVFERMGFENFVAGDFFTWAAGAAPLVHSLAARLASTYNLGAVREDLLKELYQELVDPQTRHDLGEFYTPDWLAELTLREAGFPSPQASLLDPACGSGTFLFTAVRLLREAGLAGEELIRFSASHLAGLDVHPLAVTIAKVNLILALGDDLRVYGERFNLPVYMADALTVLERKERAVRIPVGVDTIAQQVGKPKDQGLPTDFWLPADLADRPEVFHAIANALLEFANAAVADRDARDGFNTYIRNIGVASESLWLWNNNLRLMRWLLREPVTDTVWRFILQNAYQPELFAQRKFAFVVGNPPWLSYRFIRRLDYQERIRKLTFRYGLLDKKQAHLFTQMELATLFFAYCADRYLAEGGTVAFVMPRSILTGAKQHNLFRHYFIAVARRLIDCEGVAPLFNVPACVVIWDKRDRDSQACGVVPVLRLEGALSRKNLGLSEVQAQLTFSETLYTHSISSNASPYLERVVNGATIYPRCLWFVCPPKTAKILDRQRPQLETDPGIEQFAKQPWKGIRLSGSVEAEFLFATLLSNDLLPFGWRSFSLVVLPVVQRENILVLLTPDEAIRLGKTGLADWLRKADAVWRRHRKSSDDLLAYLNWQGKLTRQRPKRVWKLLYNKSGTHLSSCVVDANTDMWQIYDLPVSGFVADKMTYWMETSNGDEAHFLAAILNSPLADEVIKPFQTRGALGERDIERRPFEVLPIPLYNGRDERHRQLAELSRRCHTKVTSFVADADVRILALTIGRLRQWIRRELLARELAEINSLVAEICCR